MNELLENNLKIIEAHKKIKAKKIKIDQFHSNHALKNVISYSEYFMLEKEEQYELAKNRIEVAWFLTGFKLN